MWLKTKHNELFSAIQIFRRVSYTQTPVKQEVNAAQHSLILQGKRQDNSDGVT